MKLLFLKTIQEVLQQVEMFGATTFQAAFCVKICRI